jgi:hypothetical protein
MAMNELQCGYWVFMRVERWCVGVAVGVIALYTVGSSALVLVLVLLQC